MYNQSMSSRNFIKLNPKGFGDKSKNTKTIRWRLPKGMYIF